ncbi:MAG: adenylate/guanylate cyclase domain-containing protein [Brevinematia bacterium]
MKRSLKDVIILFSISLLSFLFAYILTQTFLARVRDAFVNGFFRVKEIERAVIAEGVQKREVEGLVYTSDQIVIVGIDDKTLSRLGKYPFPRRYYDEYFLKPLYSEKDSRYPNSVFFDIVFSEYSVKEEDSVFFNSLAEAKKRFRPLVDYIFYFATERGEEGTEEGLKLSEDINVRRIALLRRFVIPRENIKGEAKFLRIPSRGVLPLEEVVQNSWGAGYANLVKYFGNTDTYNAIPMVLEYNGEYYPSIVLVILCAYYETTVSNVFVELGKEITIKNAKIKYPDGSYRVGDVKIPVDGENLFFINYVTRSEKTERNGMIRTISLWDLHRIKGLGKYVEDKILMVGMLTYGYGDIWKSPIADNMYGIEHLANAVNNIIMATIQGYPGYVKVVSDIVVAVVSLLLSLIATLILILNRSALFALVQEIAVLVLFVFVTYFLFSQGTIILQYPITKYAYLTDILTPILSSVLAYIGGQVFVIAKERAQRMQIKGMLDSYVSPEVVNILLRNPEKLNLGGEDREVTIFFSDIRGFTTLSEGLTPQELVALINRYLSRMTDIIMDNRGTVDKYIGDAIMAFWGAPLDDPEHPFRACKASLEMLEALKELNASLPTDRQIDIGIGINTGIATIGNMGSTKKKNYTAMGDTVNLASRLEGVNKLFHTRVIISESTYERVKDRILARELDLIRVKGKKLPVRIYEVIGFLDSYDGIIKGMGLREEDVLP